MDSLNKLIFAIFGRAAADYLGGAFMYVIYALLFLVTTSFNKRQNSS
jgi:hypothetical protein